MTVQAFVNPDEVRAQFSRAMSAMYKAEVPLYGALLELVAEVNRQTLERDPALAERLRLTGEIDRSHAPAWECSRRRSASAPVTGRRASHQGSHAGAWELSKLKSWLF